MLFPTTNHLKESQVGVPDVVERDLRVDPRKVLGVALPAVVDDVREQPLALVVDAFVKLSAEKLDAHDGEDEPEDEADEQDVDDGGDGVHEGVDDNLKKIAVRR